MNYILGIGLLYQRYKKNAVVKIYMDDKLLDIYDLEKDVKYAHVPDKVLEKILNKFKHYKPNWFNIIKIPNNNSDIPQPWSIPSYIRLLELKKENIGKKLKIEIDNNNSNYTNGFMSKSSLIHPALVFLCPINLLKDNGKKLAIFKDRYQKMFINLGKNMSKVDYSEWLEKARISWPELRQFDIVQSNKSSLHNKIKTRTSILTWPRHLYRKNIEAGDASIIKDWEKTLAASGSLKNPNRIPHCVGIHNWIGGSFEILLEIKKKNGVHMLHTYNLSKGIPIVSFKMFSFAHYFSHKYK